MHLAVVRDGGKHRGRVGRPRNVAHLAAARTRAATGRRARSRPSARPWPRLLHARALCLPSPGAKAMCPVWLLIEASAAVGVQPAQPVQPTQGSSASPCHTPHRVVEVKPRRTAAHAAPDVPCLAPCVQPLTESFRSKLMTGLDWSALSHSRTLQSADAERKVRW